MIQHSIFTGASQQVTLLSINEAHNRLSHKVK